MIRTCCASLLAATLALTAQADVAFLDATFDSNWSTIKLIDTTGPGATGASGPTLADGLSSPSRETVHTWQTSLPGVSLIFGHMNSSFTYNPSSAPVDSIDVSFDLRLPAHINHVNTMGYSPMIEQDGSYFQYKTTAYPLAPSGWLPYDYSSTTSDDWTSVSGVLKPDFTSSGSTITFGYATLNGGSGTIQNLTAVGRIDNFSVNVIPEPSSIALLSMSGLIILRWRQRR